MEKCIYPPGRVELLLGQEEVVSDHRTLRVVTDVVAIIVTRQDDTGILLTGLCQRHQGLPRHLVVHVVAELASASEPVPNGGIVENGNQGEGRHNEWCAPSLSRGRMHPKQ